MALDVSFYFYPISNSECFLQNRARILPLSTTFGAVSLSTDLSGDWGQVLEAGLVSLCSGAWQADGPVPT